MVDLEAGEPEYRLSLPSVPSLFILLGLLAPVMLPPIRMAGLSI